MGKPDKTTDVCVKAHAIQKITFSAILNEDYP